MAEYAEDVGHYWKTSETAPDTWVDKAEAQIEKMGGEVIARAHGRGKDGEAYMLAFRIGEDRFKITWPVLPTKSGSQVAARRQAATMLYRDVKARTVSATVMGPQIAFFSYWMLPDGRAAAELPAPELSNAFPRLLDE